MWQRSWPRDRHLPDPRIAAAAIARGTAAPSPSSLSSGSGDFSTLLLNSSEEEMAGKEQQHGRMVGRMGGQTLLYRCFVKPKIDSEKELSRQKVTDDCGRHHVALISI